MATFSYSFCMGLLHSLWQAALLWLVFVIAEKSLQHKFTPLQKKNFLFVLLGIQAVLFICTVLAGCLQPVDGFFTAISKNALPGAGTPGWLAQFTPWFFSAYIVIITYKVLKAVYEWHLFKTQFKNGRVKPSVELKLFTAVQQYHFGIKRTVQLWFSNTIAAPVTFGFLKPVIVLPVALINQLSVQQAETLILHELAHIRGNDFLLNWFLIIAETVFFFNPFIRDTCKKIRLEREKYCDITVTAFDYSPLLYAETLLTAQTVKQFMPQLRAENYRVAAVNKTNQLLNRIRFFINPANQVQQHSNRLLPLFSFVTVTAFAAALILQLQLVSKKEIALYTAARQQAATAIIVDKALPVVVKNAPEYFTVNTITDITAAAQQQQLATKQKLKQQQQLGEASAEANTAAALAEKTVQNNVFPVSLEENDATKQVVVSEEQSGSKNATIKVYNVIFKNGQWQLQPHWKLAAKEIRDSGWLKIIDTTEPLLPESNEAYQD